MEGKHKRTDLVFVTLLICMLIAACQKEFSYSLYDAKVPLEYCNTTEKNLQEIRMLGSSGKAFKIAVMADNHYFYDELKAAIDHVNRSTDIGFVILAGDITDQGLLQEYLLFYETMKHLQKPYLTVIGNHEYLSNGEEIYRDLFGSYNYSLVFNDVKIILFNDIFWENEETPDFNWLAHQLAAPEQYEHTIVVSHIPPFDPQFTEEHRNKYSRLMLDNAVSLSVHGHMHSFYLRELYGDGVKYLGVPRIKEREYCEISIEDNIVTVEKINY